MGWDDSELDAEVVAASEQQAEETAAADAAAEEAKPEEAEPTPEDGVVQGTDPKKLIFKHWVRPKFLQYSYLYNYRHNYYDDVINYLDRRNHGLPVEKPRAQTWAERALRTYIANEGGLHPKEGRDGRLLHAVSTGARFHRYHSKSLISRKYSRLGINTVSI